MGGIGGNLDIGVLLEVRTEVLVTIYPEHSNLPLERFKASLNKTN